MDPDEDLLTRSAREPTAFEPLVARHSAALHGYLVRRAPSAADDLLSEVWLQAYAHRGAFDAARGSARGWLFGVARNVLARHRQTAARAAGRPQAPADAVVGDPWQAVDQRLDAAAVGPRLRSVLAALPEAERELLLLVAWEQLTPAEAAAAVGIPAGTARSRLHRARARLRDGLTGPARTTLTGDFA
ncbi:RNA polymerase sigma factor [Streptomyces sp. ITFR-16]|uniref:RNA polymerase sigma factor n=1 Tax=Streptomyces sp. ITFR-16 TaxID=3075198 RepID=UPI00288B9C2D|nr:RNA polymerase sigma factor [Streptomyces sp. ITFR-16]WNI24319.1 RNA polymerase sigma factor [Streptomyces sp. ITFR-16]